MRTLQPRVEIRTLKRFLRPAARLGRVGRAMAKTKASMQRTSYVPWNYTAKEAAKQARKNKKGQLDQKQLRKDAKPAKKKETKKKETATKKKVKAAAKRKPRKTKEELEELKKAPGTFVTLAMHRGDAAAAFANFDFGNASRRHDTWKTPWAHWPPNPTGTSPLAPAYPVFGDIHNSCVIGVAYVVNVVGATVRSPP